MPVQNSFFKSLIVIDRKSTVPVYHQIANTLIHLMTGGRLKPGFKMPPSRDLAVALDVNRTTITSAYEELKSQGWIDSFPKKGIFVSRKLPLLKPQTFNNVAKSRPLKTEEPHLFVNVSGGNDVPPDEKKYRLIVNDGFPDARIAPLASLFSQYRSLQYRPQVQGFFMNGPSSGSIRLRTQLALFLSKSRMINVGVENILTTRGAQAAIFIAARMLIKPGSIVIVGDPGYNNASHVFEHLGAKLLKVKVDNHGLDVDEVEKICKTQQPAFLYIIPHHHHPTTVTLTAERRMKLLETVRSHSLPVIEDDYDYDFHYDNRPILPLASADHTGHVIYIGSVTKTLAPSIRVGYMVASREFIRQASHLKELIEIRGDVVIEEALASLYRSGDMQKHINRSVKLYKARRDTFCSMLAHLMPGVLEFAKPLGGMSIWVKFKTRYPLAEVSRQLALKGIYLNDGTLYNSGRDLNSIRIGFASLNDTEMKELVQALSELKGGKNYLDEDH